MPDKPDITFKSAENASPRGITFVMSGAPDPDWKNCFSAHWGQNQLLANSGLQRAIQGNKLTLTGAIGDPQAILDELKKIAVECNKKEDEFQAKIDALKF